MRQLQPPPATDAAMFILRLRVDDMPPAQSFDHLLAIHILMAIISGSTPDDSRHAIRADYRASAITYFGPRHHFTPLQRCYNKGMPISGEKRYIMICFAIIFVQKLGP